MPICWLPTDVLIIIFGLCAAIEPPNFTSVGSSLGWIKLSHVNRTWRIIILGSPLLWSEVVCNFWPEAAQNTILDRARDVHLSLRFPSSWYYRVNAPRDLLQRIIPRARLIHSPHNQSGTLSLAGLTLQHLEELDIDRCYDAGSRLLVAPSLKRLAICSIPWTISAPHLRTLKIVLDDKVEHLSLHIIQLPDYLASFPALKHLAIIVTARHAWNGVNGDLFPSAVHAIRGRIQGVLTALDQVKPAVNMPNLSTLNVRADTSGSHHGQFAALLATMFWRSLEVPYLERVHFTLSEQIQPVLELVDSMQMYLSTASLDALAVTYSWPGLEFTFSSSTIEECAAQCASFKLPSCDNTSFIKALRYFSGNIGRRLRELHLSSLSNPGPVLHGSFPSGHIARTHRAGGYPFVQIIEVHGPASVLTRVLELYELPRLQTITLHTPQHDHHELAALAGVLRTRAAKMKRLILRGRTAYSDETKFAREVIALRLLGAVEVVVDERDGQTERASCPRLFEAGDRLTKSVNKRTSGIDGRDGSPRVVVGRRRTGSGVRQEQTTYTHSADGASTRGRAAWR